MTDVNTATVYMGESLSMRPQVEIKRSLARNVLFVLLPGLVGVKPECYFIWEDYWHGITEGPTETKRLV